MTYLLQISIGPVQGFISASRKTRDLAMGSHLLSQLAARAARFLADEGAEMIFPPSPDDPAANILLAKVTGDPGAASANAKAAVQAELRCLVHDAKKRAGGLVDPAVDLDAQSDRLLEWYAAWAPIGDNYAQARRRVGTLMAGRKALRDFLPEPPDGGRPKSPLDPAFPGVLLVGRGGRVDRKEDHRVKEREHLDAVGLYKRFGEAKDGKRFPSTRKIATAHLLHPEGDDREEADDAAKCRFAIDRLETRLRGYEDIADIGDVLFGDVDGLPPDVQSEARNLAREIRGVRPLRAYYAVLHADGDGMGELLNTLAQKKGEEGHREFSRRLSAFAQGVEARVAIHRGIKIFAGGDDVVALAPLELAIPLARSLRDWFEETVSSWATEQIPGLERKPSLTVGVGAAHVMDNLQESIDFARKLEHRGKHTDFARGRKNALVVGARPRGGADIWAAGRWDEGFDERVDCHMKLLSNGGLPRGYPYEIRALAEEIGKLQEGGIHRTALGAAGAQELISAEIRRIVKRKQKEGNANYEPDPMPISAAELQRYADMLLVAHFLTRESGE